MYLNDEMITTMIQAIQDALEFNQDLLNGEKLEDIEVLWSIK